MVLDILKRGIVRKSIQEKFNVLFRCAHTSELSIALTAVQSHSRNLIPGFAEAHLGLDLIQKWIIKRLHELIDDGV